VQTIYEGNVRFEHCYRLDMDPSIVPPHRRACWQDWLDRHTFGQSTDRVGHAHRRLVAIEGGDAGTLSLHIDAGTDVPSAAGNLPMPTNVHEAPPPRAVKPASEANSGAAAAVTQPAKAPEAECSDECLSNWRACGAGCGESPSATPTIISPYNAAATNRVSVPAIQKSPKQKDACATCRREYKSCMRNCFRP
jgi:hypothetical protein